MFEKRVLRKRLCCGSYRTDLGAGFEEVMENIFRMHEYIWLRHRIRILKTQSFAGCLPEDHLYGWAFAQVTGF